jgi:Uma2 family endonuclease
VTETTLACRGRTVIVGQPPELIAWLDRRRTLGQDHFDEVWEGEYHAVPAPHPYHGYVERQLTALLDPLAQQAGLMETGPFNLGEKGDYRVPDGGYHRALPTQAFVATAAVLVEVVSPDDETYEKFDFYARHGVHELIVADSTDRRVRLWRLQSDGTYAETASSALLGIGAGELTEQLDWPAGENAK